MRFLADECCDALIVRTLRHLGHNVDYVAELAPGLTDHDVLAQSVSGKCILITEDRDFGDLIYRSREASYGVILVRIPAGERQSKAERIAALLRDHSSELRGAMTILTPTSVRIRPLPDLGLAATINDTSE